jgi:hypothetical protein
MVTDGALARRDGQRGRGRPRRRMCLIRGRIHGSGAKDGSICADSVAVARSSEEIEKAAGDGVGLGAGESVENRKRVFIVAV